MSRPVSLSASHSLPLRTQTPGRWARAVLAEPLALLNDHAFLEKKAANNALDLLTKWPEPGVEGWAQVMTDIARDEALHLSQVHRLLTRRGGRLQRMHKNPYANALRLLVRKGAGPAEMVDRLLVSALIELRSCERFSVLATESQDSELAGFYQRLSTSERGHYLVFLKLARAVDRPERVDHRWEELLEAEARILGEQEFGPRIHSGLPPESPCN
ncbi:MAG: tRNA-(ms[2]io[6]A)-hydroxylase [Bryobacteraceae bacterium]|nr:tRNA-(ms[2]io[6]A)-hydroxylase [Bryobacteraceae bacterium]MDW8376935.1 tRNA-(ms[2]io[6]A)-hydroxylase [Bryobacterales bacterium]